MTKAHVWVRTSSETVSDCPVFDVRRDTFVRVPDNKSSDFYVLQAPDWVNVVARTGAGDLVMIEQFRYGTEEMNLELPGGIIDEGEEPAATAARELLEETGYSSDNWILLGSSRPNPAIQTNRIYHFLALDCEKTGRTELDENESIETKLLPENEIEKLIMEGTISHSLVVAAFYYLNGFENGSRPSVK